MNISSFLLKNKKKTKGFTLIELLVVVAILIIMTSISMFNYDEFGKFTELENDTYLLALSIREAQVYGVNKKSREATEIEFGESYSYGVYFNKTTDVTGVDSTKFILYVDGLRNDSTINLKFSDLGATNCTAVGNDECFSQIEFKKGNKIKELKVHDSTSWNVVDEIDIQFRRPNPDALIKSAGVSYGRARIIIEDKFSTFERCVEVGSAGDISIRSNC
ncbi:MAG: type II secretion system protein [Candidatus Pacebacteria bacterium]|nr:type II secretion system protein [Candidatus Paceibacterota bacterium]